MALANSFWLWGLSALSVPLIIHLLSRWEGKVIRMGSLRYLQDSNTQQFKSLRLNEIILFILRCLLIITLVLFLCHLRWPKSTSQKWVIVEEQLQNHPTAVALKDSLLTQGYELHTLSNDFLLDGKSIGHSYWSLSEHVQNQGIVDALFLSTAKITAFKGKRSGKSALTWITIPNTNADYPIAAIRKSNDSVTVINARLENENTHYNRNKSVRFPDQSLIKILNDSIPILPDDTVQITLVSNPAFSYDKKIMKALLNVIQSNAVRTLIIDETDETTPIDPTTDWLIWFSEKELPTDIKGSVIQFRQKNNVPLLQQESPSCWLLTQRLNEETILNSAVSTTLAQIILPENNINQLADAKDQRTMPDEMMWAASSDKTAAITTASSISLDHYLILLFLLIWITERIIAYQRNQ